jgi:tetratricopeptide (TPR) repeat protein
MLKRLLLDMRIRRLILFASVLVLTAVGSGTSVAARESSGTPAARTALDRGEAAVRTGELDAAVAAFRKAIAVDPGFVDAHQRLIEITQLQQLQDPEGARLSRLQRQYERWARRQPKRAVYQVALGLLAKEPEQAAAYYNKALALDPAFARAHFLLARIADNAGDWDAQRQHLKAAVESNRDEPRYLLRYAVAHEKSGPARFRELALQVVAAFPTSPSAAEALYILANASTNPERRGYLDRLRASYPVDRFPYAASAMNVLYADLTEPSEALALARDMVRVLPAATVWPPRVAAQDAMLRAKTLIDGGQFKEALALLDTTAKPSGNHGTTWTLLKAEAAAGGGNREQAYETLIESAAASPDGRVDAALAKYATALAKTNRDVDADVWNARDAHARPAAPFTLSSLRDGAPVRLADFRGRVVLLAFWYPT